MTAGHAPNAPVWKACPIGHEGPWHPWYGGAYSHLTTPGKDETIPGPIPEHFEKRPPYGPEVWTFFLNSVQEDSSSDEEEADTDEDVWLLPPSSEDIHSERSDVTHPDKNGDVV